MSTYFYPSAVYGIKISQRLVKEKGLREDDEGRSKIESILESYNYKLFCRAGEHSDFTGKDVSLLGVIVAKVDPNEGRDMVEEIYLSKKQEKEIQELLTNFSDGKKFHYFLVGEWG